MTGVESIPNLWKGVPFHAGDRVLLEWLDSDEVIGRAVWKVPAEYTVDDPDFAELGDENSEGEVLGLIINGSEYICPDRLTVLAPDEHPIKTSGYRTCTIEELVVGDPVQVGVLSYAESIHVELVMDRASLEGQDDGVLYNVFGMRFDDAPSEHSVTRFIQRKWGA